jgi:hypothetical protein
MAQIALDAAVPVTEGIQSFLNEELEEMTIADATLMLDSLKVSSFIFPYTTNPGSNIHTNQIHHDHQSTHDFLPKISPQLTIEARGILREQGLLSFLLNSGMALPTFLGILHTQVNTNTDRDRDSNTSTSTSTSQTNLPEHVHKALESTLLAEKCSLPTATTSNSTSTSTTQSSPSNDLSQSLRSVCESLGEIEGYIRATGGALREYSDDRGDLELKGLAGSVCEGVKQLEMLGRILGDAL